MHCHKSGSHVRNRGHMSESDALEITDAEQGRVCEIAINTNIAHTITPTLTFDSVHSWRIYSAATLGYQTNSTMILYPTQ